MDLPKLGIPRGRGMNTNGATICCSMSLQKRFGTTNVLQNFWPEQHCCSERHRSIRATSGWNGALESMTRLYKYTYGY